MLTIFNKSVENGEFPKLWKEALITPMHKKGGVDDMANYRPVSCLPAASKLLEKLVCEQLSDYSEKNGLLPTSQHGFHANRSTMTAWADMQEDWSKNSEDKSMTGILLWDLFNLKP